MSEANAWDEGWAACSDWWHANAIGESSSVRVENPYRATPEPDYCHRRDRLGMECIVCDHEHCGWCGECHPEVPEW